jgi:hypothetical protein
MGLLHDWPNVSNGEIRDGWDLLAPGQVGRVEQDIGPMGHRANSDQCQQLNRCG